MTFDKSEGALVECQGDGKRTAWPMDSRLSPAAFVSRSIRRGVSAT